MSAIGRTRQVALLLIVTAAATGCSSSEAASACLSSEGAKVCAVDADGSIQIEATGLRPGSELVVEAELLDESESVPESSYLVGDGGAPEGRIGFIRAVTDEPLLIRVSAVGADGDELYGELVIPEVAAGT